MSNSAIIHHQNVSCWSFRVSYCGFSVLDFNTISAAAFRWIVGELLELMPLGKEDQVSLKFVVDDEGEKAKIIGTQMKKDESGGTELVVLEHNVDYISKFFRWPDDPRSFAYLIRSNPDFPFTCHAFTAETDENVQMLAELLREFVSKKSPPNDSRSSQPHFDIPRGPFLKVLPSADDRVISPAASVTEEVPSTNNSNKPTRKTSWFSSKFEVLYLCRVELTGPPSSYIVDEASRRYEEEYKPMQAHQFLTVSVKRLIAAGRSPYDKDNLRRCLRFSDSTSNNNDQDENRSVAESGDPPPRTDADYNDDDDNDDDYRLRVNNNNRSTLRRTSSLLIDALLDSVFIDDGYASASSPADADQRRRSSAAFVAAASNVGGSISLADIVKTCAGSNRSMLIIIGRNDISMISLNDKEKLLQKRHTEISSVVRGSNYPNNIAFVCPDPWRNERSDCFVIRCQDAEIADSIIHTMRAAFTVAFNEHASAGGRHHACDRCPLYQYSCLCADIDGMQPKEIHDTVIRRINRLSPAHQRTIWSGYENLLNECGGGGGNWNRSGGGDAAGYCFSSSEETKQQSNNARGGDVRRKNIMLMSVLRSVCESAQILHSQSIGKLSSTTNGPGGAGGTAVPVAVSDSQIYLSSASDPTTVSSNSTKGEQHSSSTTVNNEVINPASASASSSSSNQRFSAVNKLASLRDRAKGAFGGSLDSFKRKLNNNDNESSTAAMTTNREDCGAGVGKGRGGSSKLPQQQPPVAAAEMMNSVRPAGECGIAPPPNEPVSPAPPRTPPSEEEEEDTPMSTLQQATFHFDTPNRRGSDGDIVGLRPRSSTLGDVLLCGGGGGRGGIVGDKHTTSIVRSRLADMHNDPNIMKDHHSNSSLVNMTHHQHHRGRRMSWRQAILSRVVSPRLYASRHSVAGLGLGQRYPSFESRRSSGGSAISSSPLLPAECVEEDPRPTCYYKSLWKKAIMEQILNVRLDNQKRIKESEETRKLKLIYEEITPCSEEEVRPIWLAMLNHPNRDTTRFDRVHLEEAVKAGVPRDLRREAWKFLLSQHNLDRAKRGQLMETPPEQHRYQDLLKELTSYQHAILIDLGRTFPSHGYFSQPLGSGQLSLFNILKAYSLFDPEVGYCQGLSFVAGVLLLHMEEEDSFEMLVDMMYRLQLRRQYRPDMMALQIEMYQLSRLLHDRHRDLHEHLEEHEIPILYAAPWFLTLFASAFPLGFVARVFDFVFLAGGLDVVFKIALILLGDHKELIKHCDSFESISDFLKTTLPSMSIIQMERVFNQVVELDISRELLAYEVEYHVLQEEVLASPMGAPSSSLPTAGAGASLTVPGGGNANIISDAHHSAELAKLDTTNKFLKRQNMELLEQLQQARHQLSAADKARLEMQSKLEATNDVVSSYQCKLEALQSRMEAMEMERRSLLSALQRFRDDVPPPPTQTPSSNNSPPAGILNNSHNPLQNGGVGPYLPARSKPK